MLLCLLELSKQQDDKDTSDKADVWTEKENNCLYIVHVKLILPVVYSDIQLYLSEHQ